MSVQPSSPSQTSAAQRLFELFRGADHHGTYRHEPTLVQPGEKISIRGSAKTIYEPPTPDLWQLHLDGTRPLGICPLWSNDTCLWGAIDLDDRDVVHSELVARVRQNGLPLVVCRSKSGGAHLYVFLSEPMPAIDLQRRLREFSDLLGFPAKTEIFPKQTRTSDIDKAGGWLNVPYFQGEETTRYAVKNSGLAMSLPEFLDLAEESALIPAQLMALKASPPARTDDRKKAEGSLTSEEFEKLLQGWLRKLAEAPGGKADDTLMEIARDIGRCASVIDIDYAVMQRRVLEAWNARGKNETDFHQQYHRNYAHGQKEGNPPRLADGGDGDDRYPTIEKIVVLTGGEEDEWRLTLRGWGDVTLPVREVMHYYTFNVRCAARLGAVFDQMKQNTWYECLREARARAEFEAIPETETEEHEMRSLLRVFLTDKHKAESLAEVLLGKPYHDEDEGRRYFRFEDFHKYLRRQTSSFGNMKPNIVGRWVRRAVGKKNFKDTDKMIKGKSVKLYYVPAELFDATPELALPKIEPSPI
ncbi:hypothetical protein [Rhizobium sp. M1]|uniref:TOTE conflict system archaeo-eukaryotic primase domain-containing protein n=1 Tax=Rhizobium sp. M1 TaxID=2035453 RepID=UPI000BE85555|nr:hypothetical protein [Rhizobium sp. M1]PDT07870.1 hypothetical protein CO655_24925 [Rhizobium sp. M1]